MNSEWPKHDKYFYNNLIFTYKTKDKKTECNIKKLDNPANTYIIKIKNQKILFRCLYDKFTKKHRETLLEIAKKTNVDYIYVGAINNQKYNIEIWNHHKYSVGFQKKIKWRNYER